MFRFLAKDRSHRQRLELHSAIAAAAPPPEEPSVSLMDVDTHAPVVMPRRTSVQIEELERPIHRRIPAQTPTQPPGTSQAQGGSGWSTLYAPHDEAHHRRSSLDCIRSAKRSGGTAPRPVGADESSVEARSVAAMTQQRNSDGEDEVSSGGGGGDVEARDSRRHRGSRLSQQQPQQVQRSPFECAMDEDVQQVPRRDSSNVQPAGDIAPSRGAASRGYYAGSCGGTAAAPSTYGDRFCDMSGWGGMDQALQPAGLMQARAAMVAQGRASSAGNHSVTFPDMM